MRTCPHCSKKIQDQATVCKHCHKPVSQTKLWAQIAFGVVVASIAFFIITRPSGENAPSSPKSINTQPTRQVEAAQDDDYEEYRRSIEIRDCSQKYIANMLRSPSTADHGLGTVTKIAEGKYVLRSYVDAENAYGAALRANYTCNVELSGRECRSVTCQFDQ